VADEARKKEWQQLGDWQVSCANKDRALVATGSASEQLLFMKTKYFYRGVAQLGARDIWEHAGGFRFLIFQTLENP
jgi:hypothetical protein